MEAVETLKTCRGRKSAKRLKERLSLTYFLSKFDLMTDSMSICTSFQGCQVGLILAFFDLLPNFSDHGRQLRGKCYITVLLSD